MTLTPAHVAAYIQYTRYSKDKQYSDALIKQTIELISKHKVVVSNITYKVDEGCEYILAKPHSDTTSLWLFLVAGKEVGYKGALNLPNTEYEKDLEINALVVTEKLVAVSTLNNKTGLCNVYVFKQIFKHPLANSYEYASSLALQKELQTCFKTNEAYENEVDLLEQLINICKPNL